MSRLAPPTLLLLALSISCGRISIANDAGAEDAIPGQAQVIDVTSPAADGAYANASNMDIHVTFSEPVTVVGTPQLSLNSGAADIAYTSGSGSDTLVFAYTVATGEYSPDLGYPTSSALSVADGSIDGSDGPASLSLPMPGSAGSLSFNKNIVIDAMPPFVLQVSSPTPDGSYTDGDSIVIGVLFNEPVEVFGGPQLTLNSGAPPVAYTGGSGTDTLAFRYNVGTNEDSPDLDYVATDSLDLGVDSVVLDLAGNDANIALPMPGAPGSLGDSKDLVITGCASGTTVFDYTGGLQTFVVPEGCSEITIDAWGAEGGTSSGQSGGLNFSGGRGARAMGTFSLQPGQAIRLLVGGRGADSNCGSGGGGGSFAVLGTSLLVAAGGGGGGFHCNVIGGAEGVPGNISEIGGTGVCGTDLVRNPTPGGTAGNGANSNYGGGGGGYVTAGTSNQGSSGGGAYPGDGGPLGGGYGGGGGYYSGCCGGSGGGGGYSGGGGSAVDGCAGGGGASFNSGMGQTMTGGARSGHGQIVVSW